jgi:hypothetical protein
VFVSEHRLAFFEWDCVDRYRKRGYELGEWKVEGELGEARRVGDKWTWTIACEDSKRGESSIEKTRFAVGRVGIVLMRIV